MVKEEIKKPEEDKEIAEAKMEKDKEEKMEKVNEDIKEDVESKIDEEKVEVREEKIKKQEEEKVEVREEKMEKAKFKEEFKKKEKKERIAVLNIYTTFNNTIINITDLAGNTIAKFTGGQSTKQNRLKANPTIAMFIAQKVAEEAKDNGITGFYVKIRAGTGQNNPGPGAHAAIKSLTRARFKILSIMDSTRIARGGPKKKGGRRGRRV